MRAQSRQGGRRTDRHARGNVPLLRRVEAAEPNRTEPKLCTTEGSGWADRRVSARPVFSQLHVFFRPAARLKPNPTRDDVIPLEPHVPTVWKGGKWSSSSCSKCYVMLVRLETKASSGRSIALCSLHRSEVSHGHDEDDAKARRLKENIISVMFTYDFTVSAEVFSPFAVVPAY